MIPFASRVSVSAGTPGMVVRTVMKSTFSCFSFGHVICKEKKSRGDKVNDVVLFLKRKSDVNPRSKSIIKGEASEPYRYSRHNGMGSFRDSGRLKWDRNSLDADGEKSFMGCSVRKCEDGTRGIICSDVRSIWSENVWWN